MPKEEKRRFRRIKLRTPLHYQIRGYPEFSKAVSEDIGMGGLGFISDAFIPTSKDLTLQINLLSRVLNPIATVRRSFQLSRSDRYYVGIEFTEFDPTERKYLSDYVGMQTEKNNIGKLK